MQNKKFNFRQKKIRDLEWSAFENEIKNKSGKFLDVGAGTGYGMYKAETLGLDVFGIEPCINEHGVFDTNLKPIIEKIIKGNAEQIPFPDNFFDIVYASHSLEHFQNMEQGLSEINRVLKHDGIVIIIVPTGLMSFVSLLSQYIFTTHRRIGKFFLKKMSINNFRNIFIPYAHGSQYSNVLIEVFKFRVKVWEKLLLEFFTINGTLLPCLYPYPDFPQLFPYISNNKYSSSAIFICTKMEVKKIENI